MTVWVSDEEYVEEDESAPAPPPADEPEPVEDE